MVSEITGQFGASDTRDAWAVEACATSHPEFMVRKASQCADTLVKHDSDMLNVTSLVAIDKSGVVNGVLKMKAIEPIEGARHCRVPDIELKWLTRWRPRSSPTSPCTKLSSIVRSACLPEW